MRVLQLCNDSIGGAGRAAYRLHEALLQQNQEQSAKQNIESIFYVQNKTNRNNLIITENSKIHKAIARIKQSLDYMPLKIYKQRANDIFSINFMPTNRMLKIIDSIKPDIVHLHWINGAMINLNILSKIKCDIVWSMHDCFSFTGGCHCIHKNCNSFYECNFRCQTCTMLGENKYFINIPKMCFNKKEKIYNKTNIYFIGLSNWITNLAKSSNLLKNQKIINLPNAINTQIYSTMDKKEAKKLLGFSENEIIIGFGAVDPFSNERKGYKELIKALKLLKNSDFTLCILGGYKPILKNEKNEKCTLKNAQENALDNFKVKYLGELNDDLSLKIYYNALDLFIQPSLFENLSNMILESISCGTPVAAFDIGGNADLITHNKNGFLVKDYKELATTIDNFVNNIGGGGGNPAIN